jgi:arylsulfatase A-like enzyme
VRFENMYATDTPCLPSRTAFFSGRFGINTGVINHGGSYADLPLQGQSRSFRTEFAESTLASMLRRAGYHTASISPFPNRHSAYQIWYGFTETYDTGKGGVENADEIYPHVKKWLERNGKQDNWFLHVNLWDPHTPYDHPESYGNPFQHAPMDGWLTQDIINSQRDSFGPHSACEVPGYTQHLPKEWRMGVGEIRTLEDAKAHLDGYDTGIHYADFYISNIIQDLKDLGIFEDTAIILCADHGENQGELNVWGGSSFAASLSNTTDAGRDYLVLSQGAWSCQRAVRWADWLLIRTYHTGLKDFPAYMLFNLKADPHETTNLAATHRQVVNEGLQKLDNWLAEQMPKALRGDPFWGVIAEGGPLHANEHGRDWHDYLERLKSTGRAHHAEKLKAFGGRPFESGLKK